MLSDGTDKPQGGSSTLADTLQIRGFRMLRSRAPSAKARARASQRRALEAAAEARAAAQNSSGPSQVPTTSAEPPAAAAEVVRRPAELSDLGDIGLQAALCRAESSLDSRGPSPMSDGSCGVRLFLSDSGNVDEARESGSALLSASCRLNEALLSALRRERARADALEEELRRHKRPSGGVAEAAEAEGSAATDDPAVERRAGQAGVGAEEAELSGCGGAAVSCRANEATPPPDRMATEPPSPPSEAVPAVPPERPVRAMSAARLSGFQARARPILPSCTGKCSVPTVGPITPPGRTPTPALTPTLGPHPTRDRLFLIRRSPS